MRRSARNRSAPSLASNRLCAYGVCFESNRVAVETGCRVYPRVSTGFALIADDAAAITGRGGGGSVRDEMEKLWGGREKEDEERQGRR